jgi:hypothetical protein
LGKAITQTLSDYSHLHAFSCREVPLPLPLRRLSALIPSRASPQLLAFRTLSMPQPGSLPRSQQAARTCEPCAALCRCVSAGVQELDAHTSKLPFDFPPAVCTRINNLDYLRNEVQCTRQWPALRQWAVPNCSFGSEALAVLRSPIDCPLHSAHDVLHCALHAPLDPDSDDDSRDGQMAD